MDADAFRKPASQSLPAPPALFAARARSARVADLSLGGGAFSGPADTPPRPSNVAVPFLWEEAPGKPIAGDDLQDDSGHAVPLKLPPRLQHVPASSFAAGDSPLSSPRILFQRKPPKWARDAGAGAALRRTASSGMGFLSRTWSKHTAATGCHKNRGGDHERFGGPDAPWCSPVSSSSSSSVSTCFCGDDHGHLGRWRSANGRDFSSDRWRLADGRDFSSEDDDGSPRGPVRITRFWKNRTLPSTTSNLWMDNLVTIYHGGNVEKDRYGYVEFVEMQSVPVLFNDRPSFSELVAQAREELHCHGDDVGIAVEGVLHLGSPPTILRRIISIGCEHHWENYVRSAMKSQLQCLDVVVRQVLVDPTPQGFSPPTVQQTQLEPQQTQLEPPIRDLHKDVEVVPTTPNAQFAPNEVHISQVVGDDCRTHDVVADPPLDIPLT